MELSSVTNDNSISSSVPHADPLYSRICQWDRLAFPFQESSWWLERLNDQGSQVGTSADLNPSQLLHVRSTMTVLVVFDSFKTRQIRNLLLHDVPCCCMLPITRLHAQQSRQFYVPSSKAQNIPNPNFSLSQPNNTQPWIPQRKLSPSSLAAVATPRR